MKCVAMRLDQPEGPGDVAERLVGLLGLSTAEAVLEIVEKYYPRGRIPPKTRFGVEELMGRLADRKDA
jgi:hypothetical protein